MKDPRTLTKSPLATQWNQNRQISIAENNISKVAKLVKYSITKQSLSPPTKIH